MSKADFACWGHPPTLWSPIHTALMATYILLSLSFSSLYVSVALRCLGPERIEWFTEDRAFLWSNGSAPARPLPPPLYSQQIVILSLPVWCGSSLRREWGEGRAWSRIIRPQECLALYQSFHPLCLDLYYLTGGEGAEPKRRWNLNLFHVWDELRVLLRNGEVCNVCITKNILFWQAFPSW